MPAQWTADLIGKMHIYSISAKDLATKIGWHPKYLSAVLNGRRDPKGAEVACNAALDELIAQENHTTT